MTWWIKVTSAVSVRYEIGVRPQAAIVSAICNKTGVDLHEINLSRSTLHRKRFRVVENLGNLLFTKDFKYICVIISIISKV